MRPRRPLAATLLACAAVAAGCGGDADEKNAYVDEVQTAQRSYVDGFGKVLRTLSATSTLAEDRSALGRFGKETERFGAALGRVEPPDDVRRQHGALIAAVEAFEARLDRATSDLRSGTTEDRARVRTELSSSVADTQRDLTRAISDINAGLRG